MAVSMVNQKSLPASLSGMSLTELTEPNVLRSHMYFDEKLNRMIVDDAVTYALLNSIALKAVEQSVDLLNNKSKGIVYFLSIIPNIALLPNVIKRTKLSRKCNESIGSMVKDYLNELDEYSQNVDFLPTLKSKFLLKLEKTVEDYMNSYRSIKVEITDFFRG